MLEIRPARRDERDAVLDLLALWYNDRSFFARYNLNDPCFRDELCQVALDQGRIVSSVQIFDRLVNLAGQAVPMAGIGSVYTREEYRGRGIASALMRLSVETMEREGFEVALLFAERLNFYAQFGWRSVERQFSVIGGHPATDLSAQWQIDLFDAPRDLAPVAAIHRAYSTRFEAVALRDDSYWRGNLKYAGNPDEYFVVARRAGTAQAYARAIAFYGFPMIMEFGYAPGGDAAILALLYYLGGVAAGSARTPRRHQRAGLIAPAAGATGASGILSHTAHDPRLESKLREAGFSVVHHTDNFYMWRTISAQRLGKRLGVEPAKAADRMYELVGSPRALFWTSDRF